MPHDLNGNLLMFGDRVLVEFEVTSVGQEGPFCNVSLKTVEKMPGNGEASHLVVNAKMVNKIMPPDESDISDGSLDGEGDKSGDGKE